MARPRSAAASMGCHLQAGAGIFKHRLTVCRKFRLPPVRWGGRRNLKGAFAAFETGSGAFLKSVCHGGWNRLPVSIVSPLTRVYVFGEGVLSINSESDRAASLVIGPTSLGMVRIYVESEGIELPMDFEPDEALEIADELRAAAEQAMATAAAPKHRKQDHGDGRGGKRTTKRTPKHNTKPKTKHGGGGGRD